MIALAIIGGFAAFLLYVLALAQFALWLSGPYSEPNIYFPTLLMGLVIPLAIAVQLAHP